MPDQDKLEAIFKARGFDDFRWIEASSIVVAQWVRLKCQFGCSEYGKTGACPPNTPSVAECERFFREYRRAVIFHFLKRVDKPEDRKAWSLEINSRLLDVERDVFLSGRVKAFLLFMDSCALCKTCAGSRTACKNPKRSRPGADAMAMDVYSTVLKAGYPIEVLPDFDRAMNRYAFLLID